METRRTASILKLMGYMYRLGLVVFWPSHRRVTVEKEARFQLVESRRSSSGLVHGVDRPTLPVNLPFALQLALSPSGRPKRLLGRAFAPLGGSGLDQG